LFQVRPAAISAEVVTHTLPRLGGELCEYGAFSSERSRCCKVPKAEGGS
jgi:hypothetical protein